MDDGVPVAVTKAIAKTELPLFTQPEASVFTQGPAEVTARRAEEKSEADDRARVQASKDARKHETQRKLDVSRQMHDARHRLE